MDLGPARPLQPLDRTAGRKRQRRAGASLQPGETIRVPVYYAGLQLPWDQNQNSVSFNLTVTTSDNATPIDWASLEVGLRPSWIDPNTWTAIYPGLIAHIGPTWGGLVSSLDADASYLGRLGEQVTDVSQLWRFEILQAIGLNPVVHLAMNTDVKSPCPRAPANLQPHVFAVDSRDRSVAGPLGFGVVAGWRLATDSHETVRRDG